jgi:hypothetical protein
MTRSRHGALRAGSLALPPASSQEARHGRACTPSLRPRVPDQSVGERIPPLRTGGRPVAGGRGPYGRPRLEREAVLLYPGRSACTTWRSVRGRRDAGRHGIAGARAWRSIRRRARVAGSGSAIPMVCAQHPAGAASSAHRSAAHPEQSRLYCRVAERGCPGDSKRAHAGSATSCSRIGPADRLLRALGMKLSDRSRSIVPSSAARPTITTSRSSPRRGRAFITPRSRSQEHRRDRRRRARAC